MRITSIKAVPISYRVPEGQNVRLGIGRAVKRDAVLVKVTTDQGPIGWGEAHHGRCPGAIARLIDTTISELVVGMDAMNVVGVWQRVYQMQLASHGMGYAAAMALSGLDLALWDIRAKAAGWPLYRLLGGASKPIKAYAGGISLGWQPPESLAQEALGYIAQGYRAIKLRVGDNPRDDVARATAVREAVGDAIEILVDANTNYTLDDVRRVMPAYDELQIGWLEEPFPAQDYRSYQIGDLARHDAAGGRRKPLHALRVHPPDRGWRRKFRATGSIQDRRRHRNNADRRDGLGLEAAVQSAHLRDRDQHGRDDQRAGFRDVPGYFEGDVASNNPFRDEVGGVPYALDADGCVKPSETAGLGVEINEEFINAHPLIEGPCYV